MWSPASPSESTPAWSCGVTFTRATPRIACSHLNLTCALTQPGFPGSFAAWPGFQCPCRMPRVCVGLGPALPSLAPGQPGLVPLWLMEDGGDIPSRTVTPGGTASHDPCLGSRKSPLPAPQPWVVEVWPCPGLCLQVPLISAHLQWVPLGLDPPWSKSLLCLVPLPRCRLRPVYL